MASRIRKRSSFSTDSFARMTLFPYSVSATLASVIISAITTITSMSVNPSNLRTREPANRLPVTVLRPIQAGATALRIHVKDVLPAPRRRIRLVLIGPQPPFGAAGHRIDRDASQVLQLRPRGVIGASHAFDERLEIRRIPLTVRAQLRRRNLPHVDRVLELVDRGPDLAQVPAQLRLALPLRRHLRERQHRRRKNHQDGDDDEQLDEGVTAGISHFHVYRTVTAGTGPICSDAGVPPGAA